MGSIVCVDSKPGSAHALARRGHAVTRIEDATQASAFFERPADLWLRQGWRCETQLRDPLASDRADPGVGSKGGEGSRALPAKPLTVQAGGG